MPEFKGSLLDSTLTGLKSRLVEKGWYEVPWVIDDAYGNPQTNLIESLQVGNTYWPTMVNRTFQVRIGLSLNQYYIHDGRIFFQHIEYSSYEHNRISLAGIVCHEEFRRRSYATKAMSQVIEAAREANACLRLEPIPLSQYKRPGYKTITTAKLVNWYKSLGFIPLTDYRNQVMEFKP